MSVLKSMGLASRRCLDKGKQRAQVSEPLAVGRVQAHSLPWSWKEKQAELEGEADVEESGGKRMCLTGCAEVSPPREGGDAGEERS